MMKTKADFARQIRDARRSLQTAERMLRYNNTKATIAALADAQVDLATVMNLRDYLEDMMDRLNHGKNPRDLYYNIAMEG